MSAAAATRRKLRTRPLFWIAVILLAALAAGYLGRPQGQRAGATIRSYFRTTPDGVAALARGIDALGRRTAPRLTPFADADPVRGTIALVGPRRPPSPRETRALLDHVRGGGTLLYVPRYRVSNRRTAQTTLMDSLDVHFRLRTTPDEALDRYMQEPRWADHPVTEGLGLPNRLLHAFRVAGDENDDASGARPLLTVTAPDSAEWAAAAEIELGSGRVVVLAESGPLSNGRVADHPLAAAAIRAALSYTDAADTVFFSEYHQGISGDRSSAEVLWDFLSGTPWGRALLHLVLLCFLALACAGLRFGAPAPAVAPPDRERRSPLEHVSALGDLYRKAGAARTAALLLVGRLARTARHTTPRDVAGADALLRRMDAGQGADTPLARARKGLRAYPPDLPAIAAGIDEHLSRRISP